jgi:hypothetical protein
MAKAGVKHSLNSAYSKWDNLEISDDESEVHRLQFRKTCHANARLEHSQPEACMPQLRGVGRNHTASLVLVARFVERPAGSPEHRP